MIGNDPRYQAIIDQYKQGALNAPYQSMDYTPSPYYNPIYDIRTEQIAAGELPEGARFPKPQLDTTPTEEKKEEEQFDPCPPGYQLVDGVCQPDTMFDQGGGRDQEFTGPKISPEGLIEGYEQVLSPGMGAMNSMQMMELEKRFGADRAREIGLLNQKYRNRGVQYDPVNDRFVAMSPTLGQLAGDIGGGFSSILGGIGDAAQQYLSGGGMLGALVNLFTPKQPTVRYGGSSDISVSTQPMTPMDSVIPTGIVRPGSSTQPTVPTGINRPGYSSLPTPTVNVVTSDKIRQQQELANEIAKADRDRESRDARNRASQAAKRLGTKLATRGR